MAASHFLALAEHFLVGQHGSIQETVAQSAEIEQPGRQKYFATLGATRFLI
jgi:hypothetical protein